MLCQLNYTHHMRTETARQEAMVRQKGLEPPTCCLEGSCSIRMSYWRGCGAGDENRTRIPSLEGWCPDHCATPACPVWYVSLCIIAGFRRVVKDFRKFFCDLRVSDVFGAASPASYASAFLAAAQIRLEFFPAPWYIDVTNHR